MVPSAHALRASLALKLWAIERKSHIMALVADEGLALFCGLNAMPKKSFLSEYSSRITPQKVARLLALWHAQVTGNLFAGQSLNLDFHSVPYFGEHPLVESHYLAKRSRRQPSILVFLAQDAGQRDPAMKILLVDDHVLVREALRGALQELEREAAIFEALALFAVRWSASSPKRPPIVHRGSQDSSPRRPHFVATDGPRSARYHECGARVAR